MESRKKKNDLRKRLLLSATLQFFSQPYNPFNRRLFAYKCFLFFSLILIFINFLGIRVESPEIILPTALSTRLIFLNSIICLRRKIICFVNKRFAFVYSFWFVSIFNGMLENRKITPTSFFAPCQMKDSYWTKKFKASFHRASHSPSNGL